MSSDNTSTTRLAHDHDVAPWQHVAMGAALPVEGTFGARLRALMTDRGLNQQQLAELAGIDKGAVSRHLRLEQAPSAESLSAYCRALGVSADFLVHGRNATTRTDATPWDRALEAYEWPDVDIELIDDVVEQVRTEGPQHPTRPESAWRLRIRQLLRAPGRSSIKRK